VNHSNTWNCIVGNEVLRVDQMRMTAKSKKSTRKFVWRRIVSRFILFAIVLIIVLFVLDNPAAAYDDLSKF